MSKIKGSDLSVGQLVSLHISNTNKVDTVVVGPITGIQEWNSETIAIQVAGLDSWIILRDSVEIGAV